MAGFEDGTIKVWDTDSFNLLETRPGEAMAFSEEAEDVVRNGATILVKDGGGAFYAPSPILYVAVSWPRIAAGAQSGELYHLEVVRERIATRNQLPMKTKKKISKTQNPPLPQHLAAVCRNPRCGDISRKKGLRFGQVRIARRRVSFGIREIPLNMSQLTGDINVDGIKSGIGVRVLRSVHVLSVLR